MARLRQISPNSYRTGEKINAEFEQVIRYINSAEIGDKTLGELLEQLFDDNGDFAGPIDLKFDPAVGLQFRVGTYTNTTDGWQTIASASAIRGASGVNVGTINQPLWTNRVDYVATGGETDVDYTMDLTNSDVVVFLNGLLKRPGGSYDYTLDDTGNKVTFNSALTTGDKVNLFTIRSDAIQGYKRSDYTASTNQVVFAFPHDDTQQLIVYRNGILQREGGSYDYTHDPAGDTVSFMSGLTNGDQVSIVTIEDRSATTLVGIMLEDDYTDGNGAIPFAKLSIADGAIPQAKINGLTALLQNRGRIYVQSSTPSDPASSDQWLDTSTSPNVFKVYNGSSWIETSPNINIPTFDNTTALKYLRVNSAGNALEWVNVDLSSRVPNTAVGAVNGVCPLDSNSTVPLSNLPDIFAQDSLYVSQDAPSSGTTYTVKVLFNQKIRIDALALKTDTGTMNVDITVDGSVVTSAPVGATSTLAGTTLTNSIEVDATSTPRRLGIKVSSFSGTPGAIEAALAVTALTV